MNETRDEQGTAISNVVVYGSDECPFTKRARAWLQDLQVDYRYVNVDRDKQAEALIASWNNNHAIRPTLDVGGQILVNPGLDDLQQSLRAHHLLKG